MAQYEANLRDYWLVARRRRMIILASTVLVALLSFWLGKNKVPVYQATAAVKFEQSTALSGLLVEVLSYSTADNIETQATLIKSSPILEEVARRMGRLPQVSGTEALRESRAYAATLESLSAKLRTSRVGGTSILEITATSTIPLEARDLANTVAEVYRDYSRNNRNARIVEARKFIEGQLRDVEARVRRAEEEVWAFRDANRIISPGAESTMLLSLFTQVRGDIEKARQQRIELEQVGSRLERSDPASVTDRVYIDTQNPAIQRLVATQTDLILERNNLALEVTERHPRLQAIDDRLREVRREMRREVAAQIALLRNREEILGRQMGELFQRNREVPAVELNLQRLQRDAKVNDDLLTLLKTRHQEALIKESEGVEEVTIVRPASEPTAPIGSEGANMLLLGAVLGLVLGVVLAFIQETLDTSIGTIEDVESYLEVPVLGIVPHIDPRETMQRLVEHRPALAEMDPEALQSHALLITHFDPKSPVAEAYRTLRTNVQFARLERGGKVLVVTSPTLQEGKTTTIVNLALTMAQSGQKTLLVGANMRRPSIHRFFGIEREPGLSDILTGNAQWRDCIRTVADILMGRFEMEDIMAAPGLDNLHIIEAGPIPANPSELLSTSALAEFLRAVAAEYDIVLIDTPPVLPVTDSAIVAGQADGVLLVYQAGKVGRLVLKRAKAHLESTRAKVWGVVLNDVQTEVSGYTYTHYYTHYYGEETPSPREGGAFARAWERVRSRVGRSHGPARASAAGAAPSEGAARPPAGVPRGLRSSGRARYRNPWIGLGVLGGLLGVLAAVGAWQAGVFGPDGRPLAQLRQRLGIGPAAAPASRPAAPAGPAAPAAPTRPPAASTPPAVTPPAVPPAGTSPSSSAATPSRPVASVTTPAPPAPAKAPTAPSGRFAVEFGPFLTTADAERVERQLTQAGYQTARFRQSQTGAGLYAVLLERVPAGRDPQGVVAVLREQGFTDPAVVQPDPPVIRLGDPLPLRGAVDLAERARALGHPVRVAAQPGEAVAYMIRHGNFASLPEAAAKAEELGRLGLAYQVIQVR
ncbi:MAG TPA: polysaccharide biosynthesis tyrosine autokinase [Methylomirabilota bacterium]|nr:polysaccharide biosynthesis tyrosine autokinase [Methylomirabilota bacterium]